MSVIYLNQILIQRHVLNYKSRSVFYVKENG